MRAWVPLSILALTAGGPAWAQRPPKPAQVARPAETAKAAAKARTAKAAATVNLARAGVALDLPEGWSAEPGKGDTEAYTLLSGDQVTTLMVFSVPSKDLQGALADLDKSLQGMVTGAAIETPKHGEVGGMPAIMADGRGKVDDHDVDLGLMLVLNEARQRVLFIVGFAVPGKGEGYAKDVAAILHSVRPTP